VGTNPVNPQTEDINVNVQVVEDGVEEEVAPHIGTATAPAVGVETHEKGEVATEKVITLLLGTAANEAVTNERGAEMTNRGTNRTSV